MSARRHAATGTRTHWRSWLGGALFAWGAALQFGAATRPLIG
jgi:hypothetical protein